MVHRDGMPNEEFIDISMASSQPLTEAGSRVGESELPPHHDEAGKPRAFHSYRIYGITVRSEIPLSFPEQPVNHSPDITFFLAPQGWFAKTIAGLPNDGRTSDWYDHVRCPDGSDFLCWPGLFEFLVSPDGRWVACRTLEQATHESFQTYLLGQVLSFALVKLGHEPLHATTVVVEGSAVAFLGDSGYGKSSLAAVFVHAGHQILTDDLLLIRDINNALCGYPGPPRIKLFPQIAEQFLPQQAPGSPMNPETEKLIIPLDRDQVAAEPAPIHGFYSLQEPTQDVPGMRLVSLSGAESIRELLRATFNVRLVGRDRLRRQFLAVHEWATRIAVRRLAYPRKPEMLQKVYDAILSDIRSSCKESV